MVFSENAIEIFFGLSLLLNAILFIPQAVRIKAERSSRGVSKITFLGFFLIQLAIVMHALVRDDSILLVGYSLSLISCGYVVYLIFRFKGASHIMDNQFLIKDVVSQLPGHLYWKDKDFRYLGCNRNNWEDLGLSSETEIINKTDYDLLAKEDADRIRRVDEAVLAEKKSIIAEEFIFNNDGKKIVYITHKRPLISSNGEVIGILGCSLDITDSNKSTQDKLAILDGVIAVMPGNVYWMDKDGSYLGCNENEARSIGLGSRHEIVGLKNKDLGSFVIADVLDPVNQKVIETGLEVTAEEPAVLAGGRRAIYLTKKGPIYDAENNIVGLVGVSINIDERKKAEERAEKESALKTRVMNILHKEMNTVVETMVSQLDLATRPTCENPRVLAAKAINESQKISEIFNAVSNYLSVDENQESEKHASDQVNIKANILKYMETYGGIWDSVDAELSYTDKEIEITKGNGRAIRSVLRILVRNAYRFADGKVKISVKQQGAGESSVIKLEIVNDGKSISNNDAEDILNMFVLSREDVQFKALGPNLALANLTIKKLGGFLKIHSVDDDKGTRVELDVPFKKPEWSNQAQQSVLIVDDNDISRKAQKILLEEKGYSVTEADSADEALPLLNNQYCFILMDLSLPTMSGEELTRCFRSTNSNRHTPIVAITANPLDEVLVDHLLANFDEVIEKPLRARDLDGLVERYCLRVYMQ